MVLGLTNSPCWRDQRWFILIHHLPLNLLVIESSLANRCGIHPCLFRLSNLVVKSFKLLSFLLVGLKLLRLEQGLFVFLRWRWHRRQAGVFLHHLWHINWILLGDDKRLDWLRINYWTFNFIRQLNRILGGLLWLLFLILLVFMIFKYGLSRRALAYFGFNTFLIFNQAVQVQRLLFSLFTFFLLRRLFIHFAPKFLRKIV